MKVSCTSEVELLNCLWLDTEWTVHKQHCHSRKSRNLSLYALFVWTKVCCLCLHLQFWLSEKQLFSFFYFTTRTPSNIYGSLMSSFPHTMKYNAYTCDAYKLLINLVHICEANQAFQKCAKFHKWDFYSVQDQCITFSDGTFTQYYHCVVHDFISSSFRYEFRFDSEWWTAAQETRTYKS